MSYQVKILKGLFVLRWNEPEPGDAKRYYDELAVASRKQGQQLVALFIMPEDSPAPGEEFRKEQAALLPKIMDCLEFAVAVFEGGGFATSIKRSALVAILLLSNKRHKIFVRRSVEEALVLKPPGPLTFNGRRAAEQISLLGLSDVRPSMYPQSRTHP
jgi:hypothetical protein